MQEGCPAAIGRSLPPPREMLLHNVFQLRTVVGIGPLLGAGKQPPTDWISMIDVLAAAVIAMAHPQAPVVDTTTTVLEDDPAWDCRTMGNRVCGVGALLSDGSPAVPGDYSDPNCWPGAIFCPAPG